MRSSWPAISLSCALLTAAFDAASAADESRAGVDAAAARACEAALQALSAAEDETLARRARSGARDEAGAGADAGARLEAPAAPAAVLQRRRAAALACLRTEGAVPPRDARVQPVPPVVAAPSLASVPTAAGAAPGRPVPLGAPARAEPLPRPAPPVTVTACDPTGCWASDGTRLQRTGPQQLLGPRGPCTAQGPFLSCP